MGFFLKPSGGEPDRKFLYLDKGKPKTGVPAWLRYKDIHVKIVDTDIEKVLSALKTKISPYLYLPGGEPL